MKNSLLSIIKLVVKLLVNNLTLTQVWEEESEIRIWGEMVLKKWQFDSCNLHFFFYDKLNSRYYAIINLVKWAFKWSLKSFKPKIILIIFNFFSCNKNTYMVKIERLMWLVTYLHESPLTETEFLQLTWHYCALI